MGNAKFYYCAFVPAELLQADPALTPEPALNPQSDSVLTSYSSSANQLPCSCLRVSGYIQYVSARWNHDFVGKALNDEVDANENQSGGLAHELHKQALVAEVCSLSRPCNVHHADRHPQEAQLWNKLPVITLTRYRARSQPNLQNLPTPKIGE